MEDLSQHILDIAFNSIEAGATELTVMIQEDPNHNLFQFKVLDNGRGITPEEIPLILDPFYTTKKCKRVGIGVPLLREAVDRCGGRFEIKPSPLGRGTAVIATFPYHHLDRVPLGDITGTIITLIAGQPHLDLAYHHRRNNSCFDFSAGALRAQLQDIPLHTPEVLVWLKDYLNQKIAELRRETSEEH